MHIFYENHGCLTILENQTCINKYLLILCRLLGFLSFDVDVSQLDINQCDSPSVSTLQLQTFGETHKCHSETSRVRNWIIPTDKDTNKY